MKCPERHIILQWVDKELNLPNQAEVEQHIQTCTDCGRQAQGFQKINQLLRSSRAAIEPSKNFEQVLWTKIIERQNQSWWSRWAAALENLIPMPNLVQWAGVIAIAVMIGGTSGAMAEWGAQSSAAHSLTGFHEFKGVPSASIAGSYLKMDERTVRV